MSEYSEDERNLKHAKKMTIIALITIVVIFAVLLWFGLQDPEIIVP